MKVELIKYPTEEDWIFARQCALVTVGKHSSKPPTEEWKHKSLAANHSYIRELKYAFKFTDIPYWVSTHLVRHIHAQPYVKTQRNDRQDKYDRNDAPQSAPVTMIWTMGAEELITIAHKRLCVLAAKETREVVKEMCRLVEEATPEMKGLLVSLCEYRNGVCTEMFPCGKCGGNE